MENLDLKFRPIAEFVLDFIHQSPAYALRYEGREGNFTKYSYDNGFFMTRLLYTLYRVDFVSLDIYLNFETSYTKLCLVVEDHTVFPSLRIECSLSDCKQFHLKYVYND